MQSKTIQLSKLRASGRSLIITVNKDIIKFLDLKANDEVWLSVSKAEKPKSIDYKCKKCEHQFNQLDTEIPYCPACDCQEVENVE